MPSRMKNSACSAALVCTLIIVSAIQLVVGRNTDLYETIRRQKTIEEVKKALELAPNEKEVVDWNLTVGYLNKMSTVSVELCEPADINNIWVLLSRPEDRIHCSGLFNYVDHYYKQLVPVCVENYIDQLAVKMRAYLSNYKSLLNNYEGFRHTQPGPYDRTKLTSACESLCTVSGYIKHMNFYEKVIPDRKKFLGQYEGYLGKCFVWLGKCDR